MRKLYVIISIALFSSGNYAQINRYLRKAARVTENGYLEKSKQYYLKVLAKDKDNYKANVGLGITLSEFQDRYEDALPYLENAYRHIEKDTLPDLLYALAKCYQHAGKYNEAISFIEKLNGSVALDDEDKFYQLDLKKRKADCIYAMANTSHTNPNDWYVINLGSNINSKMPEYVPVLTPDNELLFTSRRPDSPKEKINDLDGKYYESMYISKLDNGRFSAPRRYTIPDLFMNSKFRKHHESIISMSPDGKKLFVYRDNKIYEIVMSDIKKESPKKLSKNINFNYYQNHAYLNKDGNTLFFTSEAKGGYGGLDIYKSVKDATGNWGKPENLGPTINTAYDEDAPFLSNDGKTLFFASRGLPGYGNFDLYKTELVDGKCTEPKNLGMPINSQAHDIFMIQNTDGNIGYFSSARPGGKGDMDIYKINYLKDFNKQCLTEEDPLVTLNAEKISGSESKYKVTATLPDYLKVLKYEWKINGITTSFEGNSFENDFAGTNENAVKARIIAYCDTCYEPVMICNYTHVVLSTTAVVTSPTPTPVVDLNTFHGTLTNDQLSALGLNLTPIKFNFDKAEIREDAQNILVKNVEVLKAHPELKVEIYGYADTQGKAGHNKVLSQKRAQNVKKYLVDNGINKKQITIVIGKGATNLVNDCVRGEDCDKEHNEMNRRVELKVSKK